MKYTYKTYVIGRHQSGMHFTDDLEAAKRLSANGIIWRQPTGDWELVTIE